MARMSLLQVGRLVALFLVTFFSSIILGVLARLEVAGSVKPRVLLSVAVAALSVLTIAAMILTDMLRRRVTFLSLIITEIIWLSFLSMAWLVSAAVLPRMNQSSCSEPACSEKAETSRIFAFLSFAILLIYTGTLLTKTARLRRSSDRPAHVWTGSVRDVFAPGRSHMTLAPLPSTPSKTGFGFVVEADDDPFHPEPVSARSPSVLLPSSPRATSKLLPTSPRSANEAFLSPRSPVFVALPSSLPPVHLHV